MLLSTTGNGKTLIEKLNEMERSLEDAGTRLDLSLEEKLQKKVNLLEDELKKVCTRDMKRTETELLILNTNFTTLSTEVRSIEERLSQIRGPVNNTQENLINSKRSDSEVQSQIAI